MFGREMAATNQELGRALRAPVPVNLFVPYLMLTFLTPSTVAPVLGLARIAAAMKRQGGAHRANPVARCAPAIA